MGDCGTLSPGSRLVSHALPYLAGNQTNTLRGAASCRIWPGRAGAEPDKAPIKDRCIACNNMDLMFLI